MPAGSSGVAAGRTRGAGKRAEVLEVSLATWSCARVFCARALLFLRCCQASALDVRKVIGERCFIHKKNAFTRYQYVISLINFCTGFDDVARDLGQNDQ